jgi:hypothetical protein
VLRRIPAHDADVALWTANSFRRLSRAAAAARFVSLRFPARPRFGTDRALLQGGRANLADLRAWARFVRVSHISSGRVFHFVARVEPASD